MENITKGGKLAPIEQDMVERLRSRDDGGLGPLVADLIVASGLVADRASAVPAYEGVLYPLTGAVGQNSGSHVIQNASDGVLPEVGVRDLLSCESAKGSRATRHAFVMRGTRQVSERAARREMQLPCIEALYT